MRERVTHPQSQRNDWLLQRSRQPLASEYEGQFGQAVLVFFEMWSGKSFRERKSPINVSNFHRISGIGASSYIGWFLLEDFYLRT